VVRGAVGVTKLVSEGRKLGVQLQQTVNSLMGVVMCGRFAAEELPCGPWGMGVLRATDGACGTANSESADGIEMSEFAMPVFRRVLWSMARVPILVSCFY
jgi:hypothetical protein